MVVLFFCSGVLGSTSASKHLGHSDEWYTTDEARSMAEAVLSYQSPGGSWPKNVDTAKERYAGNPEDLRGTFDNGATTIELRYLARMVKSTGEGRYGKAFLKGLDHLLGAQYESGGWPQSYPPGGGYQRHITFNDDAMGRLMFFVRDVARDERAYGFVDAGRREKCRTAWEKGVECILNCQVKVNGQLTVWCAQHDEKTLEPRPARAYELVSLSGSESVGLVRILMSIEKPPARVVAAVEAARAYLESVKLTGIRVEDRPQAGSPRGFDRFVVEDPSADPMWARFYEIGTNRPIFCDRDGVVRYKLSDIGIERRTGYAWLGTWPKGLLGKEYEQWKARVGRTVSLP